MQNETFERQSSQRERPNPFLAGCTFQGNEYLDGTEFSDDKDPCNVCYCYGGDVICSKLLCNSDCSHPYKPPGQCCGECQRKCDQNQLFLTVWITNALNLFLFIRLLL